MLRAAVYAIVFIACSTLLLSGVVYYTVLLPHDSPARSNSPPPSTVIPNKRVNSLHPPPVSNTQPVQEEEQEYSLPAIGKLWDDKLKQETERDPNMRALPSAQIAKILKSADWLRPITIPPLSWNETTFRNLTCERPIPNFPRMYIHNAPLKTVEHYSSLTGFHMFQWGEPVPNSINPTPITYSTNDLSLPFGSWSARWVANPKPFPATRSQVTMAEAGFWVMVFRNAWAHRGNILECDRYFGPGSCTSIYEPIKPTFELQEGVPGKENEKAFVICDRMCKGYYHWVHDNLPRIALMYDQLMTDQDFVLLVPKHFHHVLQWTVGVLGFPEDRIRDVPEKKSVFYRELYYPQTPRCGSIMTSHAHLVRKLIASRLNITYDREPYKKGHQMLVVLANRHDVRQPTNYDMMYEKLVDTFPNVTFVTDHSKMNIKSQVRLFNNADLIMGPHGANLANILWCKIGCPVVEYVMTVNGNMCYYQTAAKIELEYRMVMVPVDKWSPYQIRISEVVRHVDDIKKRIEQSAV